MRLLLLLACHAPEDTSGTPDKQDTAGVSVPFTSPSEAEDQDPAEDVLEVLLEAAPATLEVPGVGTVEGYAYSGQVPGPTLRGRPGDTFTVSLHSSLDAPTTLHWHGLSVPNDVDGVDFLTSPIVPGGTATYSFSVTTPGTFWYHPHLDTEHQVDLGLYGAIVVEEEEEADDLVLVFDTWGESEGDEHGLQLRPLWTVNGVENPSFTLDGPRRGRLLNASNGGYLALPGVVVIGGDQGRYGELTTPELLVLGPGDRAEIALEPGVLQTVPWTLAGGAAWGDAVTLLTLEGEGGEGEWGHQGEMPSEDPGTTDLLYVLEGSSEGWFINGEAWPEVTPQAVALGSRTVVEVRNLSETNHPFHTHGMSFEVLSLDGVAPTTKIVEDTLDIPIRSVARLLLLADNPGQWLVHCHVLGHEDGGMMTVLEVVP